MNVKNLGKANAGHQISYLSDGYIFMGSPSSNAFILLQSQKTKDKNRTYLKIIHERFHMAGCNDFDIAKKMEKDGSISKELVIANGTKSKSSTLIKCKEGILLSNIFEQEIPGVTSLISLGIMKNQFIITFFSGVSLFIEIEESG